MRKTIFALSIAALCFAACGGENKKITIEQIEEKFNNLDFTFSQEEVSDMIDLGNEMLASMKEKYSPEQLDVVKNSVLASDSEVIEAIGEEGVNMLKTLNMISSTLSMTENPSEELKQKIEEHQKLRKELIGD